MGTGTADLLRWASIALSPEYVPVLESLIDDAERDPAVRALVLTGSLARRDALPGTDVDVRSVVSGDAPRSSFTRTVRLGVEVEHTRLTQVAARVDLDDSPMHVYAWLDGCPLVERDGVAADLRAEARLRYDGFRVPEHERVALRESLRHPEAKLRVALRAGDAARAGFVASTSTWQLVEGLWAANERPVPPHSSVRPHLRDLDGPDGLEREFDQLILGDAIARGEAALSLIGWVRDRLARPR